MQGREAGALLEEVGEVETVFETTFLGNNLDWKGRVHQKTLRLAQARFEQILDIP
jgi:hypothetical protein